MWGLGDSAIIQKIEKPMIAIRNVVKKFGHLAAVNDISLHIEAGTFFGFLGPNGAGKTTTIKILTGLLEPTTGHCFVNGYDVHWNPLPAKRSFGYVPDQPYLYDKLTGREFLAFVGGLFGMPHKLVKDKIEEIRDLFEIGSFMDRRAEDYSLGMRQRIVLSAALLHEPKAIFIDEPIIGLDPRSAKLVKETLKRKTGEGLTVFMSSHLLEIVDELCDHIAIIKQGKIIYEERRTDPVEKTRRENGELESMFLKLTN